MEFLYDPRQSERSLTLTIAPLQSGPQPGQADNGVTVAETVRAVDAPEKKLSHRAIFSIQHLLSHPQDLYSLFLIICEIQISRSGKKENATRNPRVRD